MKHSPLPWRQGEGSYRIIENPEGAMKSRTPIHEVCSVGRCLTRWRTHKANLRLILTAVNHHQELVDTIKGVAFKMNYALEGMARHVQISPEIDTLKALSGEMEALLAKIKEAE